MTIKSYKLLGGVALVSLMAFAGHSAQAADGTGTATAEIAAAITVTEDTGMDFGIIGADVAGDTITIDTADSVSATGASDLSGTPASGVFTATGTASSTVGISFSSGDTLTGSGTAMPLGNFAHDAGGSPALDGSGSLTFNVGADLTVNASQVAGTYTGNYTVTVDYN